MRNFKNNIKIISIIIGTLIGAGFASGKEIYIFFARFGLYGIFGLILSNLLIGIIIYKTFLLIKENNINNYSDFLNILFGENKFKKFFIFLINIFLLLSFFIMIAGFNSFFYQEFNIPKIITCIIICFLCFNIFNKNVSGILNINFILIPFLIFFIFLFAFIDFEKINIINYYLNLENYNFIECIIKSILYSSYNCILLIPILISLNNYLRNKKQFIFLGCTSSIFLFILSIIIFTFIILINDANILEIPIIAAIKNFSNYQQNIYSIVIAIAIFTSCISSGFGFINNIKIKKYINLFVCFICIFPIFLLNISFSFLVNLIFSIFGYIGLFQIVFILLKKSNKTDITK